LEKSDHKNEVHFEDRVSIEVLNHPDHQPSQEAALETHQTNHAIRAAIDRLPKEFKSAVVLSYLQDLSMEEIAGIEKCSVVTVKSRIFRGKQILKSLLIPGTQRSET
jgi:RNA polymerase sigma factor (sigma-70 family)